MKEQFKNFPICVNCKYYLAESAGPLQIIGTCGLTTVNPVTGEFQDKRSRVKLAAAYRKDNMPCGPSGKFFQPGKKKAEPKKKPVEEEKESTAKTITIDPAVVAKVIKDDVLEGLKEEQELPTEEPKKRRRRAKS